MFSADISTDISTDIRDENVLVNVIYNILDLLFDFLNVYLPGLFDALWCLASGLPTVFAFRYVTVRPFNKLFFRTEFDISVGHRFSDDIRRCSMHSEID